MKLFRKPGISLLVPTQNSERTVELCLRSFAAFPDEMIVVDNGSTDNTIEIVRKLKCEIPNLTFYDAPHLKDLYENRQYALERSNFNWVVRIDSDYVAYNEGRYDIKRLRERILSTTRGKLKPVTLGITQVNLFLDFRHTVRPKNCKEGEPKKREAHLSKLAARIIQYFPGMQFVRRGRWEGIRLQPYLSHSYIKEPYWFHCNFFKSPKDILFRSERTNWRELGDFRKYPTLKSYVADVIKEKHGTSDIDKAAEKYFTEIMEPKRMQYSEADAYPYPALIKQAMKLESLPFFQND